MPHCQQGLQAAHRGGRCFGYDKQSDAWTEKRRNLVVPVYLARLFYVFASRCDRRSPVGLAVAALAGTRGRLPVGDQGSEIDVDASRRRRVLDLKEFVTEAQASVAFPCREGFRGNHNHVDLS